MNSAGKEGMVAEVAGKVYVPGGYADGFVNQPLNVEYDPATNTWRARAAMPRGLNHIGANNPRKGKR